MDHEHKSTVNKNEPASILDNQKFQKFKQF